jgi:hypothetical protein
MEQYDIRFRDDKGHVDFRAEKQKLSNNIKTFKATAAQHSVLSDELKGLLAEAVTTCQNAHHLQVQINNIAEKLGLEPVPEG